MGPFIFILLGQFQYKGMLLPALPLLQLLQSLLLVFLLLLKKVSPVFSMLPVLVVRYLLTVEGLKYFDHLSINWL